MKPSNVRDSTDFCSFVKVENALIALVSAGFSGISSENESSQEQRSHTQVEEDKITLFGFSIHLHAGAILSDSPSPAYRHPPSSAQSTSFSQYSPSHFPYPTHPSTSPTAARPAPTDYQAHHLPSSHAETSTPTTSVGSTIWYCISLSNTMTTICELYFQKRATAFITSVLASTFPGSAAVDNVPEKGEVTLYGIQKVGERAGTNM